MADIDYSELEGLQVALETEDGEEVNCELQCIFEYNGQDYAVMAQEDSEENEVYFFEVNVKETKKEPEIEFSVIEDDETLEELLELFQQIVDQEFEEEDDDEGDDDDDGKWDQFITKKLGD